MGICCYGWCCPCFLVGDNGARLEHGGYWAACCTFCGLTSAIGCDFIVGYNQRQKIRQLFQLRDESCGCGDCVIACCCSGLVACQHARELKHRNYTAPLQRVVAYHQPTMMQPVITQPQMQLAVVAQQQQQQQQQQQVQVVVPQGMGPGQQLQVNAGGQMLMVVIPQGVGAGMTFAVGVPTPQPQVAMAVPVASAPQLFDPATGLVTAAGKA
jgi:Cys-rich protein (TIGR01571 family)